MALPFTSTVGSSLLPWRNKLNIVRQLQTCNASAPVVAHSQPQADEQISIPASWRPSDLQVIRDPIDNDRNGGDFHNVGAPPKARASNPLSGKGRGRHGGGRSDAASTSQEDTSAGRRRSAGQTALSEPADAGPRVSFGSVGSPPHARPVNPRTGSSDPLLASTVPGGSTTPDGLPLGGGGPLGHPRQTDPCTSLHADPHPPGPLPAASPEDDRASSGKGASTSSSTTITSPSRSSSRVSSRGISSSSSSSMSPRLRDVHDLRTLAAILEEHLDDWAARGSVSDLRAAFNALGAVGTPPGQDLALRHVTLTLFRRLTAAYLPLVPGLRSPLSATIPLWACAAVGCWEGDLALELVHRLAACDPTPPGTAASSGDPHQQHQQHHHLQQEQQRWCQPRPMSRSLVSQAEVRELAKLWWSLSQGAPEEVLEAATGLGLLDECAGRLLATPAEGLGPQDCSNVLLACARLHWYRDPDLAHHLTACLAAQPDPDSQHLANGLYALGELADDCGHLPRKPDLRGLAERVVERLRQQLDNNRSGATSSKNSSSSRTKGRSACGSAAAAVAGTAGQQTQSKPGGSSDGGSGGSRSSRRHHRPAGGVGFIPQEAANMLLACGKLGYGPPALLRPLAVVAGLAAPAMKPQELCNSLYGLARLGCRGDVYTPVAQRLCFRAHQLLHRQPEAFEPQNLASILMSLARLRPAGYDEYGMAVACECGRRRWAGFKPQEVRDALRALVGMDLVDLGEGSGGPAAALVRDVVGMGPWGPPPPVTGLWAQPPPPLPPPQQQHPLRSPRHLGPDGTPGRNAAPVGGGWQQQQQQPLPRPHYAGNGWR